MVDCLREVAGGIDAGSAGMRGEDSEQGGPTARTIGTDKAPSLRRQLKATAT